MFKNISHATMLLTIMLVFLGISLAGCNSGPAEVFKVDLSNREHHLLKLDNLPLVDSENDEDAFTFGFDRRLQIKEDVRMYMDLLNYLEKTTGYKFRIYITPQNSNIVDELGAGKIDFAAIGMGSFLQARQKYDSKMLVHGKSNHNDTRGQYQAVIFTKPDSAIKKLSDLRQKSIAFGSRTSTQGHLIPRLMLYHESINLTDLADYGYMESHESTVNAVLSGRYDAGAVQDKLGFSIADQGLIKIIAVSDYYPSSGIVAGSHVQDQVLEKVTEALLNCDPQGDHQDFFVNWETSEMNHGFLPADDNRYQLLEQWARTIGIIE
jgi:phosphonate transport system substrate-binding protein